MQMTKVDASRSDSNYAHEYLETIKESVVRRDPNEGEFHQATSVFLDSIITLLEKDPKYLNNGVLERIVEPERVIMFRVPWVDDNGKVQVNRGYRVQFNGVLGPYKGGLRYHPTVNLSVVKFLSFEQTFKNALTGLPLGGGKGGSDFDPKGKSDMEIMRFCQSFMTELANHIGPDVDVPAGDIGVGPREIGYMFGQYKRLRGAFEAGVLTGKSPDYDGSLGRREATGFGTIYFLDEMLKDNNLSLQGSTVVVSGSGNVAIYAMQKAIELGATVVACSDSDGYIYNPEGLSLETIKEIKEVKKGRIREYLEVHPGTVFNENTTDIWNVPCDFAVPCSTQNELDAASAKTLIENGVKAVAEGANMPSTPDAIQAFQENQVLFAPAKAANAGGVAVSQLEMAQNSMRLKWSFEEVDTKLKEIMKNIYANCKQAAEEYGSPNNFTLGANIAGFKRVADAMIEQGVI